MEVADVIQQLNRLDVETAVARHAEALAGGVFPPLTFPLQAHAAAAGVDFHDFRRAGVEGELRGENHADGFLRAVGKQHGMADALAVEVDIGLLHYCNVVELIFHC